MSARPPSWRPGDRRPDTHSMIRVDQAGEYGATVIYAGQLAVRDGDAIAKPGRSQRLAIKQGVEDRGLVFASRLSCGHCKLLQQLALRLDIRTNENGLLGEDVGQFH